MSNDQTPSPRLSRKAFFIITTVLIFTAASISRFNKTSINHEVKITFNNDGDALGPSDPDHPKLLPLYDELGIYVHDPNTAPNVTSHGGVYDYYSPYRERFPNEKLQFGFKKSIPYNDNVPTEKQICFVHVGKAGGSTIGCSLGFSLHCSSSGQVVPGSLLPVITTHTFHRGVYDCEDNAAYYLFVVRDPLARLMSAFNYDRPHLGEKLAAERKFQKKEFYLDCPFWTLEEVAQNGLIDKMGTISTICRERARSAIMGTKQYIPHWFFNYQYYYEFLPRDAKAKILVIRNEHIVDDWNGIEHLLGNRYDVLDPSLLPENNVHDKNSTDLYLSDDSKLALCRTLCNEIQYYKWILREALNFMEEDVLISLEELRLSCPVEAMYEVCDDPLPDITEKIAYRKHC